MTNKFLWAFKLGLFIAVLTWFSFTMYQFGKTVLNGVSVPFTDVPGSIGFGFRVAASFIAVVTVLFYLVKRDFSQVEVLNSFPLDCSVGSCLLDSFSSCWCVGYAV